MEAIERSVLAQLFCCRAIAVAGVVVGGTNASVTNNGKKEVNASTSTSTRTTSQHRTRRWDDDHHPFMMNWRVDRLQGL
jgi:hypothetical protein